MQTLGLPLCAVVCPAAGFVTSWMAKTAERRFVDESHVFAWAPIATTPLLDAFMPLRQPALPLLAGTCLCVALIAAGAVDVKTGLLLDCLTAPAVLFALVRTVANGRSTEAGLAVLFVFFPVLLVFAFSNGNLIGFGDVKAIYALAVAFGPRGAALSLFVASVSALLLLTLTGGLQRRRAVRFGPYLALGAVTSLLTACGS